MSANQAELDFYTPFKTFDEFRKLVEKCPDSEEKYSTMDLLNQCERDLSLILGELKKKTEKIQDTCEHLPRELEEVRDLNLDFRAWATKGTSHRLETIFVGTLCTGCKKFFPRKEGTRIEVCRNCGGDMKSLEKLPHMGSEIDYFRCSACGLLEESPFV